MTFCRADGGIWLLLLFLTVLMRRGKFDSAKIILIAFVILVPWFSFSFFYFGDLLPHTVSVKIMNVAYFTNSFISAVPYYLKEFYSYFIFVAILGLLFSFKAREYILIIFIYDIAYLFVFAILRAQHSHWYFIPLVPAIYIFFARGIEEFISRVLSYKETAGFNIVKKMIIMIPAFFVIFYSVRFIFNLDRLGVADTRSKAYLYEKAGLWLRDNAAQDSKVLLGEIGIIGYYSQRWIVDMGGLVTLLGDLEDTSIDTIASFFKPDYYVTGALGDGGDITLGDSLYRMVGVAEGNMGIFKRINVFEDQDVETIRKNDTIKKENNVGRAIELNFLRDFTGRDD
jgi:hypothetical protein